MFEYSKGKIDIKGNYLELVSSDIKHSYKEHHTAKQEGDINLSQEDFESVTDYIDTYDELIYATRFSSGNTRVVLGKTTKNGKMVIVEAVSSSRSSLEFKNMIGMTEKKYAEFVAPYKKRNSSNTRGSNSSNISLRDDTVSNPIIRDNSQNSNTSGKRIMNQSRLTEADYAIGYRYAVKNGNIERAQRLVDRAANKAFSDSKVRGKDGKLRKVYHWTDGDFFTFDTGRSGKNQGQTHGDGIYISTSPDEFSYAGRKRMELYANITNPFDMELTEEQAREVLEKYASTKHDLDKYDGLYRNHAMAALQSSIKVFDYLKEYAGDNDVKVSDILKDLGFD